MTKLMHIGHMCGNVDRKRQTPSFQNRVNVTNCCNPKRRRSESDLSYPHKSIKICRSVSQPLLSISEEDRQHRAHKVYVEPTFVDENLEECKECPPGVCFYIGDHNTVQLSDTENEPQKTDKSDYIKRSLFTGSINYTGKPALRQQKRSFTSGKSKNEKTRHKIKFQTSVSVVKDKRKKSSNIVLALLICLLILVSIKSGRRLCEVFLCSKIYADVSDLYSRKNRKKKLKNKLTDIFKQIKLFHNNQDKSVSGKTLHFLQTLSTDIGVLKSCIIEMTIAPANGGSLDSFFQSFENGMSLEDSMNFEWVRLRSFSSFRCVANVSPIVLSRLGFFYTGTGSEVKCYSCGSTFNQWCPNDNAMEVHRRISPNCRHLNGSDERNVPIGHRTVSGATSQQMGNSSSLSQTNQQICATGNSQPESSSRGNEGRQYGITTSSNSGEHIALPQQPSNESASGEVNTVVNRHDLLPNAAHSDRQNNATAPNRFGVSSATINKLSPLGVSFDKPRYPQYAVLTVRMSTYNGWPATQTPRKMAEAGFIYAGYADYSRCFFCGGGLRNWEEGDDPWIEHARWFPKCTYIRQNKGDNFVQLVHERLQEMLENIGPAAGHVDIMKQTQEAVSQQQNNQTPFSSANIAERPTDPQSMPAYQSVLELGYASDLIENIVRQLLNQGKTNITSSDILEVIFRMEDGELPANSSDTFASQNQQQKQEDYSFIEAASLLEENRRLREQRLCMTCEEKDSCIAFLPCGHLVCCEECAPAMRRCPKCQQIVQGSIKTWLV